MSKICNITKEIVLYIDCLECDEDCPYAKKRIAKPSPREREKIEKGEENA